MKKALFESIYEPMNEGLNLKEKEFPIHSGAVKVEQQPSFKVGQVKARVIVETPNIHICNFVQDDSRLSKEKLILNLNNGQIGGIKFKKDCDLADAFETIKEYVSMFDELNEFIGTCAMPNV